MQPSWNEIKLRVLVFHSLCLAALIACTALTVRAQDNSQIGGANWVAVETPVAQMDSSWIVSSLKVSPDSKRVACVAGMGDKQLVIVDGKEGKAYDDIDDLIFSPDSKRVAYVAKAYNRGFVVVDAYEGTPYDSVVVTARGGKLLFDSPDSFHYLALDGGNIDLVEETLKQQ